MNVVCCEHCQAELEIVCPNGHADPMEKIRKSRGPVPPAPRTEEPKRICPTCKGPRERGARYCANCRGGVTPSGTKICSRCKKEKSVDEYYRNSGKLYSSCKVCWNSYVADRQQSKAAKAGAK